MWVKDKKYFLFYFIYYLFSFIFIFKHQNKVCFLHTLIHSFINFFSEPKNERYIFYHELQKTHTKMTFSVTIVHITKNKQ